MSEPLTYEEAMAMSYSDVMRNYMTYNHGRFELGLCIFCRTETKHSDIKCFVSEDPSAPEQTDTAVCNNCGCDAIVSDIVFSDMTPQQKELVITTWHNNGFGDADI